MTLTSQIEPVVRQLQAALERRQFPTEWQQWGTRLLDHLCKPVQVAVMGLPGSGKSTLINMMLGRSVVPRGSWIPVVEIAHGPQERTTYELEDGQCLRCAGGLDAAQMPENAIRARLELTDPGLTRQNFVEIGLQGGFGHQMSMVNWVVQWADIIVWCTEAFEEGEAKLWASVPDEIKDHSFLVLTMADRQMMRGVLQERIEALEPVVSEEFLALYPIATEQAITARGAGQDLNEAMWKSSGGMELFEALMRQVNNGRTADMDQARMLLNRFAPDAGDLVETVVPEPPRAKATKPAAKSNDEVLSDALELLRSSAGKLLEVQDGQGEPRPEDVLEKCVGIATALSELLQQAGSGDLSLEEVQSDAQESAEMMMLFQLEKDEDAAVDAVTLLLQLKKEIADKVPEEERRIQG